MTAADVARTVSPTGHSALRRIRRDEPKALAASIHAATRDALHRRRLITLGPDQRGRPDHLMWLTPLGVEVLDVLDAELGER